MLRKSVASGGSTEQGFPFLAAQAMVFRGWAGLEDH
jgi:hypothetical protein